MAEGKITFDVLNLPEAKALLAENEALKARVAELEAQKSDLKTTYKRWKESAIKLGVNNQPAGFWASIFEKIPHTKTVAGEGDE